MTRLTHLTDGVTILDIVTGPEGWLTVGICQDLLHALDDLAERLELRPAEAVGVVLRGTERRFCRGFDPQAEEADAARAALTEVCLRLEEFPRPTVACLDGEVSGAGLALALAAHGRVASGQTQLVCPEVGDGQMPGGGSTQRLPRLVGAETALAMMVEGRVYRADDPALAAMIDRIEGDTPLAQAISLAKSLPASRRSSLREDGLRQPGAYFAAIAAHRTKAQAPGQAVARAVIRAVEAAALLSFERGVALEDVLAQDLAQDPDARAARYRARLRPLMQSAATGTPSRDEAAVMWLRLGYWAVGRSLLARGAAPDAIDAAAQGIGFATGPFVMMGALSGDDIAHALDSFARMSGWRVPAAIAGKEELDEALLGRIMLAGMVNLAVAARATVGLRRAIDADVIALRELGFEPAKGGLLFQAEEQGLLSLLRALQGLRAERASVLAPVPEFSRIVTEGQSLFDEVTSVTASAAGA